MIPLEYISSSLSSLVPTSLAILFIVLVWWLNDIPHKARTLPPGPRHLPLIGNMFDMPTVRPWLKFREWNKRYGDVVYLHLPMQPTVVIGTIQAAQELLDKRSAIYSSRPTLVMDTLMSWDFNLGLMPYTATWRIHRKYFHEHFHLGVVSRYVHIQIQETRAFLQRSLKNPGNLSQHIRQVIAASIVKTVYGQDIQDMNDDYVTTAQVAVEGISITRVPGAFWVEYLPILRFIPSWFPGAYFKKVANYYRPYVEKMRDHPFEAVKIDLVQNKASESVAKSLITKLRQKYKGTKALQEQELIARNVAGIAYAAGSDTTTSAAQSFFVAMAMYPDVQQKAQDELDRVIGHGRLPTLDDFASLVYIQAVALETMRWRPVLPLGVARMVTIDDEYNGYCIPKGTTVIVNAWSILHNPEDYPDPETFNPDRFIKDGKIDPTVRNPLMIAFGLGRRICPGRHFSTNSLFLFIASVLHVYNVSPAVGEDGKPVDLNVGVTTGLISNPVDTPCTLTVRSQEAEQLILGVP